MLDSENPYDLPLFSDFQVEPSDDIELGKSSGSSVNAPIGVKEVTLIRSGTLPPHIEGIKYQGDATCGSFKGVIACSNPSHVKESKRVFKVSCHRLSCKIDMPGVAVKLAVKADERMTEMARLYRGQRHSLGALKHIAFSPPQGMITKASYEVDLGKSAWASFYKLYGQIVNNFNGGVVDFHPWRKKHDDGSECEFEAYTADGQLVTCPQHHVWRWGPHFHFTGYGWFDSSVDVFKATGWVYHKIKDRGNRSVFATVFYQLTHCGVLVDSEGKSKGQVLRWIGAFSRSRGGFQEVKGDVVECACPVKGCPEKVHRYGPSSSEPDGINRNYDQGVYSYRERTRIWYLKAHERPHHSVDLLTGQTVRIRASSQRRRQDPLIARNKVLPSSSDGYDGGGRCVLPLPSPGVGRVSPVIDWAIWPGLVVGHPCDYSDSLESSQGRHLEGSLSLDDLKNVVARGA